MRRRHLLMDAPVALRGMGSFFVGGSPETVATADEVFERVAAWLAWGGLRCIRGDK